MLNLFHSTQNPKELKDIGFLDKLYNNIWSVFLILCMLWAFGSYKNTVSEVHINYMGFAFIPASAILLWSIFSGIKNKISSIVEEKSNQANCTNDPLRSEGNQNIKTAYDFYKERLNKWIEANNVALRNDISQAEKQTYLSSIPEYQLKYFYKNFHNYWTTPFSLNLIKIFTNPLKIVKSWALLIMWIILVSAERNNYINIVEMLIIGYLHQFLSSQVNRKVIYSSIYFAIKHMLSTFKLPSPQVNGDIKKPFDSLIHSNPSQSMHEADYSENEYLQTISKFMESCPPQQTIGGTQLQADLNKCLKHIGVLRLGVDGSVPSLLVVSSKSTFGANIITVDTGTVQGLTLNKLSAKKDEIENFLGWDGLRFERGSSAGYVNIIIPLKERQRILTRDMLETPEYKKIPSKSYPVPIGLTLEGLPIYAELINPITPHFLIGGGTGSGKSYLVNSILFSLLNTKSPNELLLGIIDPKGSEFLNFKDFPHVIQYVDNAFENQLKLVIWAENEMNRRNTQVFAPKGVKNILQWNERYPSEALPRILIVIDEYADIVTDKDQRKEFEPVVMRLAAKARSAGLHLMLITQKPSIETINSTLRSNLGCRIALRMTDTNSYKTLLSNYDGTALAGMGDMLVEFSDKFYRLQGSCLTTGGEEQEEDLIFRCLSFWKEQGFDEPAMIDLTEIENDDNFDSGKPPISERVIQIQEQSYTEKLKKYVIKLSEDGFTNLPGQNKVASALQCDVRRVASSIKELRESGWLEESTVYGQGDKIIYAMSEKVEAG